MTKTSHDVKRNMKGKVWTRKLWVLLITALLLVGPLPAPEVHAATFTVDRTDDSASATACTTAANDCSLRGAILKANAAAGADIISLQAGQTYTLSLDTVAGDEDGAAQDDLDVTSQITIEGNGATIQRSTTLMCDLDDVVKLGEFRILEVMGFGANLTLQNVTVRNGCVDQLGSPDNSGGGLSNTNGTATIINSTFSGNRASRFGGGIGTYFSSTTTIRGSTISGNSALGAGGIWSEGDMATITDSTISDNSAYAGGGIGNDHGTMIITSSMISGNSATADIAGGIFNGGTMMIMSSTISRNSANLFGGGICNGGTVTLTTSTISGNTAGTNGGGIWNLNHKTVNASFVTIANNGAVVQGAGIFNDSGTVNIKNSIVGNNTGGNCAGTLNATGTNLATDGSCGMGFTQVASTGAGGLNLGSLQDNGGGTDTHALLSNSAAIDAVSDCTDLQSPTPQPVTADQRGVTRPQPTGGTCDVGAFELEQAATTGTIIVNKDVVPDDSSQWQISVTGQSSQTIGDGGQATFANLTAGQYTVSESGPSGYTSSVNCGSKGSASGTSLSFTLNAEETVTCTFTNRKNGVIIVEKQTEPDGDPQTFSFSGAASGTIGDGQQITVSDLAPGPYTSTEAALSGWVLTSIVCDDANSSGNLATRTATFNLDPGETVKCTFTNTKVATGSITIIKDAVPNDPQDFSFSGDLGAFSLDDDSNGTLPNQRTFSNLTPGSYTVTEAATAGWNLTNLVCTDPDNGTTVALNTRTATIDLDAGESVTCMFTNQLKADLAVSLQDAPDPVFAGEPLIYTILVMNNGPGPADVTLSNTLPATAAFQSLTLPPGWTCSTPPVNGTGAISCTTASLAVGDTATFTLVVRVPAIGDTVRNTATVSSVAPDPTPVNNTSTVETTVARTSLAAVAVSFRPEKGQAPTPAESEPKQALVVADSAKNHVRVLMSQGEGKFKPGQTVLVGQRPVAIAVGDFNQDGQSDVVTVNMGANTLSILEGVGDGTFKTNLRTLVVGQKPNAVVVGDFNSDRRLDVVVAHLGNNSVQVFRGRGDGTFTPGRIYLVGKTPSALAAADFNQDGRLDVVVANFDSDSITVLLGRGDGTFTAGGEFLVGVAPIALAVGDFDGDGRVELITANFKSKDLSLLKNTSEPGSSRQQRFQVIRTLAAGEGPTALVTGRFLNGELGVAVANLVSDDVWVYPETGQKAFKTLQRYAVMMSPGSLVVGDYNGDGEVDIPVLNVTGESLRVLLNDSRSGRFKLAR